MSKSKRRIAKGLVLAGALSGAFASLAAAQTPQVPADPEFASDADIVVTARRRAESAQDVPIALSVLSAATLDATSTFNVQGVSQLAPSLQFSSSNPRNTNTTIRGLGASFGLANDGLEPGVGYYVDQVYISRPAAATFDLIDIERIEILRGPQGTLFGKNTTGGAISIATRAPSFTPEARAELSYGSDNFLQAKASISGPLLGDAVAGRLSAAITQRDGAFYNVTTGRDVNELDNAAVRAQALWRINEDVSVRVAADYNRQEPNCCTQVYVGFGQTLRPADQQFPALAAAAGYAPPSLDPYDRLADVNSPIQADQELGGASASLDWDLGFATLTSVSAWRAWSWRPKNDRDYTSLSILTRSENPDEQSQWSQEIRLASNGDDAVSYVLGAYYFDQTIKARPVSEWGADAARWLLGPSVPANLLDGYRSEAIARSQTTSAAAFAQITWAFAERWRLTPGLRYTWEEKSATYAQIVAGGPAVTDPALIARQRSIARPQSYAAAFTDDDVSGQITLAYEPNDDVMLYASAARGFKSGGINLAGLPTLADGSPALNSAVVAPEQVTTFEAGLKSRWFDRALTFNLALYDTTVEDFQANVVDSGPGALRGYLANVEEVGVRGVEIDAAYTPSDALTTYLNIAYSDGTYEDFKNGPCPLERIGAGTTACDLSGRPLPGLSRWAVALGGEARHRSEGERAGEFFLGADATYRSSFYSDASDSRYALIDGYTVVNARAGWRGDEGLEAFVWLRNAFDEDYLNFVSFQSGNSGLILGSPGDERAIGITVRASR
ncbi:MAG: TonB-dependent receptor [Alphaproteobacteria bacterium]|nr:TonB-dependent receptor [Alphaproteobacteria bacterium]